MEKKIKEVLSLVMGVVTCIFLFRNNMPYAIFGEILALSLYLESKLDD